MKKIELSQGKYALVDDEDYEWLSRWKWYAHKTKASAKDVYYARRSKNYKGKCDTIHMHREILKVPRGKTIDHINGNGLDNRKSNLRICLNRENSYNKRKMPSNKTGYKGVQHYRYSDGYIASIQSEGKRMYLGVFPTPIEAALAYNEAAKKYHGEFARLNDLSVSNNKEVK